MIPTGPSLAPGPASTICWGAKGGSGTTVVAAALALCLPPPVTLVDLAGDLPAVFGLSERSGAGVRDWLASDAPADRLHDLSVAVTDGITLIPTGSPDAPVPPPGHGGLLERWDALVAALTSDRHHLVVDAGVGPPPRDLHDLAERSLLVTRACYLALRRVVASPVRPNGVVLVLEPGRALRPADVETAVGAPLVATVSVDPAVARAVDAGLLSARLPRTIQRDLRGAA